MFYVRCFTRFLIYAILSFVAFTDTCNNWISLLPELTNNKCYDLCKKGNETLLLNSFCQFENITFLPLHYNEFNENYNTNGCFSRWSFIMEDPDLINIKSTPSECQLACQLQSDCSFFIFNNNNSSCILKSYDKLKLESVCKDHTNVCQNKECLSCRIPFGNINITSSNNNNDDMVFSVEPYCIIWDPLIISGPKYCSKDWQNKLFCQNHTTLALNQNDTILLQKRLTYFNINDQIPHSNSTTTTGLIISTAGCIGIGLYGITYYALRHGPILWNKFKRSCSNNKDLNNNTIMIFTSNQQFQDVDFAEVDVDLFD